MKFYFVCHNYYSLLISYIYTKNIKNYLNASCILILLGPLSANSKRLEKIWDEVILIENLRFESKSIVKKIFQIMKFYFITKINILKKIKTSKDSKEILFVFKDNTLFAKQIINHFYGAKTVLIEEGLALYEDNKYKKTVKDLFKIIAKAILLLPRPYNQYQGENNRIKYIILKRSDLIPKYKIIDKELIQQSKTLISKDMCQGFINDIYNVNLQGISNIKGEKNFDIIYIGQPLYEEGCILYEDEIKALEIIFRNLPQNLNVLIKPHPKEDISKYNIILNSNKNVRMIQSIYAKIPIEVLYYFLNTPILLTPFSSAATNLTNFNSYLKIFFLSQLFKLNDNSVQQIVSHLKSENCIVVEKIEVLNEYINKLVSKKSYDQDIDAKAVEKKTALLPEIKQLINKQDENMY